MGLAWRLHSKRGTMKSKILLIAVIAILTIPSVYATDFFDSVETIGGATPPPIYKAHYDIGINFDELQEGPNSLTFNLPNGITTTVDVTDFFPRQGYEYFDEDIHPPGSPPFWIEPGTPHEEIGYKWSGSNDDYDVLISVHSGVLYGIITGNNFRYGMSRIHNGNYRMYEFDYEYFPRTDILEDTFTNINQGLISEQDQSKTFVSHLKSFDFSRQPDNSRSNTTVIDVLIVWTEDARVAAGGDPNNANDTADIEALMVTSMDHANTALANSAMNTRLTKFHTAKYNGFSYSGSFGTDLLNFKNNVAIKNLRNQVGADTTIALIGNDFNQFEACGVAYVQTFPGCSKINPVPGCNAGTVFKESSYAMVTEFCSIWDDAFTHEIGHNMGANHVNDFFQLPAGWANSVINNGFPDAFGHEVSTFKSIMAVSDPTTARRLNFSNPDVQVNGVNTGVTNSTNNARVIDLLTPVMSNFATRPDLIFADGFE